LRRFVSGWLEAALLLSLLVANLLLWMLADCSFCTAKVSNHMLATFFACCWALLLSSHCF
jgi:hypothetical protein